MEDERQAAALGERKAETLPLLDVIQVQVERGSEARSKSRTRSTSTSHERARALAAAGITFFEQGAARPAGGSEPRSETQPPGGSECTGVKKAPASRLSGENVEQSEIVNKTKHPEILHQKARRKRYGLLDFLRDEFFSHPGANPKNLVVE
jgi:hypothetical protein